MNIAPNTAISFGTNPTVLGDYPLFNGNISGFNAADFVLPTAPAGDTYSLQVIAGNVDLVVAAVPEPGTLVLFGVGFVSLLGLPGGDGKPASFRAGCGECPNSRTPLCGSRRKSDSPSLFEHVIGS